MASRFAIAAVMSACLIAPLALSQNPSQPGEQDKQQKPDPMASAQSYVKEHDKNSDGTLTREELPADHRDSFADLDANKDNKLSTDELKDHADRMSRQGTPIEVISIWVVEAHTDPPSRQELQKVYDLLRKADSNNDGQLAQEEIAAAREQAIQKRVDAVFERCDKNNDGKIARDEVKGPMIGAFKRADQNNDGSVTREELTECCTPKAGAGSGSARQDK